MASFQEVCSYDYFLQKNQLKHLFHRYQGEFKSHHHRSGSNGPMSPTPDGGSNVSNGFGGSGSHTTTPQNGIPNGFGTSGSYSTSQNGDLNGFGESSSYPTSQNGNLNGFGGASSYSANQNGNLNGFEEFGSNATTQNGNGTETTGNPSSQFPYSMNDTMADPRTTSQMQLPSAYAHTNNLSGGNPYTSQGHVGGGNPYPSLPQGNGLRPRDIDARPPLTYSSLPHHVTSKVHPTIAPAPGDNIGPTFSSASFPTAPYCHPEMPHLPGQDTTRHSPPQDLDESSGEASPPSTLVREGPVSHSELSFDSYPSNFQKRCSMSSTVSSVREKSLTNHPQYLLQNCGSVEEQREIIKRMLALSLSKGQGGREGREEEAGGSFESSINVGSLGRVASQTSFGDAALRCLDSMLSIESSSGLGQTSSESSISSVTRDEPPSDISPTDPPREDESGSKPLRKKTSHHKLERTANVSSLDLGALEPSPPPPSTSQQARPHHPVQRQQSEQDKRFIRGLRGSSFLNTRRRSSPRNQSDEEADDVIRNDVIGNDDDIIRNDVVRRSEAPVQRTDSLSSTNGCRSKVVLDRGSIGLEEFENIRKARENLTRRKNMLNGLPSQPGVTLSNQFNRDPSYELSEVSTTPSSLSPNSSESTSQPSSLGDSGTGGEEVLTAARVNSDLSQLDMMKPLPLNYKHPRYGGGRGYENWPPYDPLQQLQHQEHFAPSFDRTPSSDHTLSSSPSSFGTLGDSNCPLPSSLSNNSTLTPQDHTPQSRDLSEGVISGSQDYHDDTIHNVDRHDDKVFDCRDDSGKRLDPHIFFKPPTHMAEGEGLRHHSHTHQSSSDSEMSWSGGSDRGEEPPQKGGGAKGEPPAVMTRAEMIQSMYLTIDRVREEHKDDIAIMKWRGKMMTQQTPLVSPSDDTARKSLGMNAPSSIPEGADEMNVALDNRLSLFPETEMELYRQTMESIDEQRAAEEDVNHREYLRDYLLGQFCKHQVYREDLHWVRQTRLGRGGQATCYSILDCKTNLSLALKEEAENDKSLDEAYICLKLANELNVSMNITEYFGAAMLPDRNRNTIQLFMEIMPTSMQAYTFRNGPLTMSDVHHFSYQLFDALEYLHNKERIIHCDVKPANLLLDYTAQRMKLADFGAAEILEEQRRVPGDSTISGYVGAGTLAYNPPEVRHCAIQ